MRVNLKHEVENLGDAGDIVEVAPGYGRNFLIPRGMAIAATSGSVWKRPSIRSHGSLRSTAPEASEMSNRCRARAP